MFKTSSMYEEIKDVSLTNNHLLVKISSLELNPIVNAQTMGQTWVHSLTDAILDYPQGNKFWNTITIDIDDLGYATLGKDKIRENE